MTTILGLLVIGLFAYVGSALLRLPTLPTSARALLTSGIGFFVIGMLLGPHATRTFDEVALADLDVVVNLGVGWVGLLFGLQFNLRDVRRLPGRHYGAAAVESAVTLAAVGLAAWGALVGADVALPLLATSLVLAAAAGTTSPTPAAMVARDASQAGPVASAVRLAASVDAVPALAVLAVGLCASPLHVATARPAALEGLLWFGISCGLGLALGALFHFLSLFRTDDKQLTVLLLGFVLFCAGAAHYLRLSPIFVCFVAGLLVANRSPQRVRVFRTLVKLEKPAYLLLFTLAGASWNPLPPTLLVGAGLFVLARIAAKLVGGALATPVAGVHGAGPLGLGPGLLAHGGMGLAIALNVKQFFPGPLGDLLLTATAASILVTNVVGPRALRRMLRRSGEL